MTSTIRAYDQEVREQAYRDIRLAAEKFAESAGAKADVLIGTRTNPVQRQHTDAR